MTNVHSSNYGTHWLREDGAKTLCGRYQARCINWVPYNDEPSCKLCRKAFEAGKR